MTFRSVVIANTGQRAIIVCEDNDNHDPLHYHGICRNCRGEQVSNDPDTLCKRCGDFVEYIDTRKTPVR